MGRADQAARAARDQADPERARITELAAAADPVAAAEVGTWRAVRLAAKAATAAKAASKKRARRRAQEDEG